MNRKNLKLLSDFLLSDPVETKGRFGMADFSRFAAPQQIAKVGHACGTAGCAVGWAPTVPGLKPDDGEEWWSYSDRIFALPSAPWDWCFSGSWATLDDTATGAGARIAALLDNTDVQYLVHSEEAVASYQKYLLPKS